jgi:ABC-2 type transport system permease protein
MLLPLSEGPEWMRAVASVNPVNWVVQAERALLDGQFADTAVLWGFVSAAAVAAVGLILGIRAMKRSS